MAAEMDDLGTRMGSAFAGRLVSYGTQKEPMLDETHDELAELMELEQVCCVVSFHDCLNL